MSSPLDFRKRKFIQQLTQQQQQQNYKFYFIFNKLQYTLSLS